MWRRFLSLVFVASVLSTAAAADGGAADRILHNGKVFTADPERPWAEAVAIRGSRILAVGEDERILSLAGRETSLTDLGGRVVVPGFNDAHVHLAVGLPRLTLPPIDIPGPGPTLPVALAQVADAVPGAAPGEWIIATVGEALILDPAADRFALDAVAPDHPVMLLTWSSHSAVLNSAGLAAAGISETERDPFGGEYGRLPGSDVVNGQVHEYALFRVFRAVRSAVPDQVLKAEFETLAGLAVRLGVTSLQEMTLGVSRQRSRRILGGADLPLRLRSICVPLEVAEPCPSAGRAAPGRVVFSGVKWLTDGTFIERSAALNGPWADFPGTGRYNPTPSELRRIVTRGLLSPPRKGQLLLHAVGDRALDNALAAFEAAAPAPVWRRRRPRLEHADLLFGEEQLQRVRRLGAVVVQNPTHLTLDLEPSLGPVRAAEAQPLRRLVDGGVALAFGSDAGLPNPFLDLFLAVLHPFHPGEGLSMEEAVTAYTRGSALAELEARRKGMLRRGFLADLAVLSQDIFTIPPPEVPETVSLLTVVGGEVVWDAGALSP